MKLEKLYQNQVNQFCEQQPMPDGHDIFRKAMELRKQEQSTKIVHFPMEGRKAKVRGKLAIALVAILVMLLGTTAVAAATGHFSFAEMLRALFHDSRTADLIEEGYFEELTGSLSNDKLSVVLIGVSGDETNCRLLYNVIVKDATITDRFDKIKLEAYILDPEVYENERDQYGTWEAYGTQDPNDHSVYHVNSPGYTRWMRPGDPYIYAIQSIAFGNDAGAEENWVKQELDLTFKLTASYDALAPVETAYYNEPSLWYNGISYKLRSVDYGVYRTNFSLVFEYLNTEAFGNIEDCWERDEAMVRQYVEMYRELILEVDGVKYGVIDPEKVGICYGEELNENDHKAYIWFECAGIDFAGADSVKLVLRDQTIDLKDTDDSPDYFSESYEYVGESAEDLQGEIVSTERAAATASINRGSEEDRAYVKRFFTEYSEDEVNANLVEQGYYSLLNLSLEDSLFDAKLVGVGGSLENMKLLLDVTVKDAEVFTNYDQILVDFYCMTPEVFEKELSHYSTWTGYGIRDLEQSNLYHCVLPAPYVWMTGEVETILAIRRLELKPEADSGLKSKAYDSGMRFYFRTPSDAYYYGIMTAYCDTGFLYESVNYQLIHADFMLSETKLNFKFTFADSDFVKEIESIVEVERTLQESFKQAMKEMTLVVDGREIAIKQKDLSSFWFDDEEGQGINSTGIIWLTLEAIDFEGANQVELHLQNQVIDLKDCVFEEF